jgi:hypothetical protein
MQMFVSHRKHTYRPPRPVSVIDLLLYMHMMFVLHRRHTFRPPWPVTGITLLYFSLDVLSLLPIYVYIAVGIIAHNLLATVETTETTEAN